MRQRLNETFIVQVSLTIVTYDRQNMFIVQGGEYALMMERRKKSVATFRNCFIMFEPDGEEHETPDFLGGNEKSFQSLRQRFGQILSLYLVTSFLWGRAFCPHVHSECLETPFLSK